MDNFLADQHIQKRRYSGAAYSRSSSVSISSPVFSKGFSQSSKKRNEVSRNTGNFNTITQERISPRAKNSSQTKKRYLSADNHNDDNHNDRKYEHRGAEKSNTVSKQKPAKRKHPAVILFPQAMKMISYPLGFIALTLIVWFLALNRDKLNDTVVNPIDDNAYQSAMASYAGMSNSNASSSVYTGVSTLAPGMFVPNSASSSVQQASFQVPNTLSSGTINLTEIEASSIPEIAIPLDLMETFSWKDYTIQRGDSISRIASNSSLSMDTLIAFNGITNAKRIREGMTLRIPNMDGIPYTVQKGDSLSRISAKFDVPLEAILDANNITSEVLIIGARLFIPGAKMAREDYKRAMGELFLYPIRGRLTSPFGWRTDPVNGVVRRHHAAIDLAAPTGTPIKASADGTISAVGTNATFGNFVIITHDGGYNTMYAHMNKIYLGNKTKVSQGTVIGEVGSTGYSTGPHLHFGVFKNGRALNPFDFLD